MSATTVSAVKTRPVTEIFGPTIQGEGDLQGMPAYFVRFGGCDFKCDWCDTPHAVLPKLVVRNRRLSDDMILQDLNQLAPGPEWVIVTGGNPVLHDLMDFVSLLHANHYKVAVETQGTRYKQWVTWCDSICVSPKPPSSGMPTRKVEEDLDRFLHEASYTRTPSLFLKVVVFNQGDYEWARKIRKRYKCVKFFLSAGNDAGKTVGNPGRVDARDLAQVRQDLLSKYLWLTNRVMVDPDMRNVQVQAQAHVLLWGNELGR